MICASRLHWNLLFNRVYCLFEHTISNGLGLGPIGGIPRKLRTNNLKNPFGPFFKGFCRRSAGVRWNNEFSDPNDGLPPKLFRKQFLLSKTKFNTSARDWITTTTTRQARPYTTRISVTHIRVSRADSGGWAMGAWQRYKFSKGRGPNF